MTFEYTTRTTVAIQNFTSADSEVEYVTLDKSADSFKKLSQILNSSNSNIETYGDGTHDNPLKTQKKIDLWGKRGEDENPRRAFIVEKNSETNGTESIGFVNLGLSSISINNMAVYEGGSLFLNQYNNNTVVATALNDIYVNYLNELSSNKILPGALFIYTAHATNPLHKSLKDSGLTQLNLNSEEGKCIAAALNTHGNRFSIQRESTQDFYKNEETVAMEAGREVSIFYNLLNSTVCNLLGDEQITTEEL